MPSSPAREDSNGETGQAQHGAADGDDGERGSGGRFLCAPEVVEMTDRSLRGGLINRNGGDSAEVSVPLSLTGKRTTQGEDIYRLRGRKILVEDKKRLCTLSLGTALLGILLMIIHAEICPLVYKQGSNIALFINCSISLSTGCLLILIVAFHYKDIRLFVIDNDQVDWRIAMSSHRVLVITVELLVCAIHPVNTYWKGGYPANSSSPTPTPTPLCVSHQHGENLMDMQLLLSMLMFLRLYLLHRAILLHSKVLLSASYRSIGSLNNIDFTFRFVLKILMNNYPARTLLVFIIFFWVTASWMLTLCERQIQAPTGKMDSAMWLIGITFLTVGYGDVAPKSSCGKAVCLFTGVTLTRGEQGVACTAMLVAVVTKMLALNKGEKHVHFFMLDIQISKRIRHAAANVLRECWLLHRTSMSKANRGEHRRHQRCLLEAIRVFRNLRLKQKKLRDYVSEMVDLPKMQMVMSDLSAKWDKSYRNLEQRILCMEQKLDELNRCFQQTPELLSQGRGHRNPEIR